jgi:hypothetical protein
MCHDWLERASDSAGGARFLWCAGSATFRLRKNQSLFFFSTWSSTTNLAPTPVIVWFPDNWPYTRKRMMLDIR